MNTPSQLTQATHLLKANLAEVKPHELLLETAGCTLGRADDCACVVARPFVSRLHARIRHDGFYFVLDDAQSANGTFVNGRLIRESHRLKHGDEIGLGEPNGQLTFLDANQTFQAPSKLRFDFKGWRFVWDTHSFALSGDQHSLMLHLFQQRGEVCERTGCAHAIWGHDYDSAMDADALDQVCSRLRTRLRGIDPALGELLVTLRGQGYLLRND